MFIPRAFSFSNASPFGALQLAGLRLFAWLGVTSLAQLPWQHAFAQFTPVVKLWRAIVFAASNLAVKRTCVPQAAYFHR